MRRMRYSSPAAHPGPRTRCVPKNTAPSRGRSRGGVPDRVRGG